MTTRDALGAADRSAGLGLRTQLLVALGAALASTFALLAIATIQLTDRATALETRQRAGTIADALVAIDDEVALERTAHALIDAGHVTGVVVRSEGAAHSYGVRAPIDVRRDVDGGSLQVFVRQRPGAPLAELLLLYVAVTGAAILLLVYVALTGLFVRPLDAVRQAAERFATGALNVRAPVRGAAEIVALARALNEMAETLRTERDALRERLDELEHATKELRSAQDSLLRSERLASVGRLSAGVAHEIGNPLAAILGLVELLRGGDLDATDTAEFLRRIQNETERIHKIIRDLLDFARQEPANDDAACDPVPVVDAAVALVAPQKDLQSITIERRYEEPLPQVRGSADQLTQLVLNLVLNAADAIEGEGTIRIELRAAEPRPGQAKEEAEGRNAEPRPGGEARNAEVELAVEDTGRGIAPEILDHLFEPFVTTKSRGHGTGLGLAVCHNLVTRLGGSIRAENAPHGGARFVVRLPIAQSPPSGAGAAP